jgi:hypothetical protein
MAQEVREEEKTVAEEGGGTESAARGIRDVSYATTESAGDRGEDQSRLAVPSPRFRLSFTQ